MAHSINRRPLLHKSSDSEDEENDNDVESDVEDSSVVKPDEEPFFKPRIPSDTFHLAYIVFYLLGINTLIPWSFFITADDYWMYKFRKIYPNDTGLHNFSHVENLEKRTNLQASFTSYMSVSSALPNTIFLIINAFISKKIPLSTRMIGSQCVIFVIFIVTTILVKVDTDKWQSEFLVVTLTSVALVNSASAIFGGSLMGIVGRFSPRYITAMSGGQALGGIFTALAEIGSLLVGASPVLSGLLYFIIGDVMLLLSLIAYIMVERAIFFKHHMLDKPQESSTTECSLNGEVTFSGEQISYTRIMKRMWPYGIAIFTLFFITMVIYPSVTVLVESENKGHGHAWNDVYFVPVVSYLLFSIGDYSGRILSGIFKWPKDKPWLVMLLSFLRIIFVPAFLVCNAQPRRHLPVYIKKDIYYIILTILFAMSNGYLCNIGLILAPTVVEPHEKEIASAMLGAFLGIGLAIGSACSLIMVKVL